jgi:hypothetical protein
MIRRGSLKLMTTRAPGKPSLSPTESDRVRKAMERLLKDRFDGNRTELGRKLSRSQPAITQLITGTNDPSLETARRVAKLEGVPVTSYLDGTAETDDDTGEFPSKLRAARAARALGLDDWAVEQMLTEEPPAGLRSDPGAVFWFRRVEQLLAAPRPAPEPGGRVRALPDGQRRGRVARGSQRP